jgi:hypothetical protein
MWRSGAIVRRAPVNNVSETVEKPPAPRSSTNAIKPRIAGSFHKNVPLAGMKELETWKDTAT